MAKKYSELSFKTNEFSKGISDLEKRKDYNQSSKKLLEFPEISKDESQRELNIIKENKQSLDCMKFEKETLSEKNDNISSKNPKGNDVKSSYVSLKSKEGDSKYSHPGRINFDNPNTNDLLKIFSTQAKVNEELLLRNK